MKRMLSVITGMFIAGLFILGFGIDNKNKIIMISLASIAIGALVVNIVYKNGKSYLRNNYSEYGKKEIVIKDKIREILFKINQLEITKRNTNLIQDIDFKTDMQKKQNILIEYLNDYLNKYICHWFAIRMKEIIQNEKIKNNGTYSEDGISNVKMKVGELIREIGLEVGDRNLENILAVETSKLNMWINEAIKKIVAKRTASILESDSPIQRESDVRYSDSDFLEYEESIDLSDLDHQYDIFLAQKEISKT